MEDKYKYQCCYCGRKFIAKVPHRCNTGFRKRHHKWLDLQTMEVEGMLGVKSNEEPIAPEYLNVLKEHGCDVDNIAKINSHVHITQGRAAPAKTIYHYGKSKI